MIRRAARYFLHDSDVQYRTVQEAIDAAEAQVEEFFRKPLRTHLSPMEWINFMDFVLRNKGHIRKLLDFSADPHQFEQEVNDSE